MDITKQEEKVSKDNMSNVHFHILCVCWQYHNKTVKQSTMKTTNKQPFPESIPGI
jgi:hypothetical protein